VALDRPLLGAGFSGIESEKVDFRYNKVDWTAEAGQQEKSRSRAAHSIYFQVLGDHGFVGFALWLAIVGVAFGNVLRVIRMTRGVPDLDWAGHLARALVVTFVAYLVTGGLLSMAYYDVFLCLLALTAPLSVIVTNRVRAGATETDENLGLIPALQTAKGK
jgi:O-antigen ligase